MANIKITDLPAAANTTGADVLPIVQSNTTKKASLSLLPVSAATQTALDTKADAAATQTALDSKVDESLLGAANGVATLDAGGKLASAQIPDIAVSDYLGAVANEAAMLALTGQKGDWCSRIDLGTNWIITGSNPAQIGSWTQLSYPASPVISVNGEVGAVVLDKSDIGLGNVDNTSDANKPISTATQTALDAKENTITAGTTSQYFRGDKTFQTLDKSAVGLGNVDNTSDADKPVSTAMQTALNAKADQVPVSSSQIIPVNGSITIADARYARRQVSTTFNGPSTQTVTVNLPTPSLGDVMFLDVSLVQAATMNINGGGFSTSLSNYNPTWGIGSANFVLICTIPNIWTDSGFHRHTDANSVNAGFMSSADKTKLDGIQSGAEVNVNADWNAPSGDAQILNKPAIPAPSNNPATSLETNPSAGTQSTYSRSDHVHPYPSASALGITAYDVLTNIAGDLATDLEVLYGYDNTLIGLEIPETIHGIEVVNFTGPAQYNIEGLFFYPSSRGAYNDPVSYPIWRSEYTTTSPTGYFYIFSADSSQSVLVHPTVLTQTYGSNLPTWYPTGSGNAPATTESTLIAIASWDSNSNQFGTFEFQAATRQRFTRHAAAQHSYFGYDPLQATDIRAAEELVESYTITQSLFDIYYLPSARSYRGTFTFAFNKNFTTIIAGGQTGDSILLTVNGGTTGGTFNGVAIPAGQQRVFRYFNSSTGWGNAPVLESLAIPIGSGGTGHNPVSNTSYFIGDVRDLNPTVSASQRIFRLPAGIIHGIALTIYVGGTLGVTAVGAGAVSSIVLVNSAGLVVGNFDVNITSNLWGASQQTFVNVLNVDIPVVAGTNYSLRINTPTFTTAPTSVRYAGYLRFRRDI